MALLQKMTTKKEESTLREEEKQMLDTYGKIVDCSDKTTIEPIVSFVKEL